MKKSSNLLVIILVFKIHATIAINGKESDFIDEFLTGTTEPPHDAVTGEYDLNVVKPGYVGPKADNSTCFEINKSSRIVHPDIDLNCPRIIEKYGYNLETHEVTTEDGYILTIFRIKGGPKSHPRPGKKAVFLMHGIAGNCMSWLFLTGNKTLAFKLADAGYDVYLGNARGTTYSQKHKRLDPNSDKYWDFSVEELGYYDIPAVIDHILRITEQEDLYYIGHSMGTSSYMVALSLRPEYGLKIRVGFLLAPAGYISDMTNPELVSALRLGTTKLSVWKAQYGNSIDEKKLNGMFEITKRTCPVVWAKCGLCNRAVMNSFGQNLKQMDGSIAHFFSAKYLDTTSSKLFCHVQQMIKSDLMSRYDFIDPELNTIKYDQVSPPEYPLDKISTPTVAYWGVNDNVTPPRGTKKTLSKFAPGILVENNRVQDKEFHHVDFILAKDVNYLIYDRIQFIMDTGMYLKKNNISPKQTLPNTAAIKL